MEERIKKLEILEGITKYIDKRIEKKKGEIEKAFASKSEEKFNEGGGI